MATPRHEPTDELREQVQTYAGYGTPHADIALALGMGKTTLEKYYKQELKLGSIKANALVAQSLFAMTQAKNDPGRIAATIFWMKVRCGWKTTNKVELTGKDGAPLAQQLDFSRLTDEEFAIFRPLYDKCVIAIAGADAVADPDLSAGDEAGLEGGGEEAV